MPYHQPVMETTGDLEGQASVPPLADRAVPPAPWAYDPGPAITRPRRWRILGLAGGALVLFGLGVVVGTALGYFGVFGAPPTVITHGAGGDVADVTVLQEGTCLSGSVGDDLSEYRVGAAVTCTGPHRFEAYGSVLMPSPTDAAADLDEEALAWSATEACRFLFAPYVGESYEASSLGLVAVLPSAREWAAGGREARCLVFDFAGGTLAQPVRGSGL